MEASQSTLTAPVLPTPVVAAVATPEPKGKHRYVDQFESTMQKEYNESSADAIDKLVFEFFQDIQMRGAIKKESFEQIEKLNPKNRYTLYLNGFVLSGRLLAFTESNVEMTPKCADWIPKYKKMTQFFFSTLNQEPYFDFTIDAVKEDEKNGYFRPRFSKELEAASVRV